MFLIKKWTSWTLLFCCIRCSSSPLLSICWHMNITIWRFFPLKAQPVVPAPHIFFVHPAPWTIRPIRHPDPISCPRANNNEKQKRQVEKSSPAACDFLVSAPPSPGCARGAARQPWALVVIIIIVIISLSPRARHTETLPRATHKGTASGRSPKHAESKRGCCERCRWRYARSRIINHQRRRIYICASAVPLPGRPTFRFLKSHPNFDKLFVRQSESERAAPLFVLLSACFLHFQVCAVIAFQNV
jgi:hypothetical protein